MFNDPSNAVANTVLYAPISSLPFTPTLSGTQYTLPMFATASTLGDSMITQNAGGTAATISGTLTTTGSFTSTLGTFSDKVVISSSGNPVLTVKRTNGNPSIAFGGITGDTAVGTMQVIGNGTDFGSYYFYSNSGTLASSNYLLQLKLSVDSATDTVMTIGKGSGNKGTINCEGSIIVDIDKTNSATVKVFSVVTHGSTASHIELLKVKDDGIIQIADYGSGTNTGTPTYNLEVDSSGNIIETPSTNPGGNGGTFSGSKDIDAGGVIKVFTLTRATTGCLVFDVFFTADFVSGVGGGPPIAEKWTVVHGISQTPVYNKIISNDGQFGTGGYDVTFADASSGTAVECSVAQRSGSSYPSLSYTIIVGYSENNALTFTPA
jgi:hypothetical protein